MIAIALTTLAPLLQAQPLAAQVQVPGAPPIGVTAFVGVAVVPMDRERVLQNQVVLVQGGQITALGPANQVKIPANAARIDGRGKYLIPGLADMHTHVGQKIEKMGGGAIKRADSAQVEAVLFLLLANGVTTIRNLDYWPDSGMMLRMRDRAAAGELWSPQIYTAGYLAVDGLNDFKIDGQQPGDIAAQVMAYKAAGYDLIKHRKIANPAALDSFVAAARRMGMPIAGHAPERNNRLDAALQAGYASIEHLTAYGVELAKDPLDTASIPVLAAATARSGVWNCPTQAIAAMFATGGALQRALAEQSGMHYLSASAQTAWKGFFTFLGNNNGMTRTLADRQRLIKTLQDSGAGLLLGTDMSAPGMVPGFSVHLELAVLVRAGLTPYQALVTGTRNVAQYFGTLAESGTITVGKRADLVLLTGNPLADIRHTAEPAGVMLGGRWLAREALNRHLARLVGQIS